MVWRFSLVIVLLVSGSFVGYAQAPSGYAFFRGGGYVEPDGLIPAEGFSGEEALRACYPVAQVTSGWVALQGEEMAWFPSDRVTVFETPQDCETARVQAAQLAALNYNAKAEPIDADVPLYTAPLQTAEVVKILSRGETALVQSITSEGNTVWLHLRDAEGNEAYGLADQLRLVPFVETPPIAMETFTEGYGFFRAGFVGRTAPTNDADEVTSGLLSYGDFPDRCFPMGAVQGSWFSLQDDETTAWFNQKNALPAPNLETCENLLEAYMLISRSRADSVTGKEAIAVWDAPTRSSQQIDTLHVGTFARIVRLYPEQGPYPNAWVMIVMPRSGRVGYVRTDFVLFIRKEQPCLTIYKPEGVLHQIIVDVDAKMPFPPEALQAIAQIVSDRVTYSNPINATRTVYFVTDYQELLRIAPWAITSEDPNRRAAGTFSYARWDGCNVQSRYTGAGELVAAAVIDLSRDPLTQKLITIHEISHLFGAGHRGWLNTYDLEDIMLLAIFDACEEAQEPYYVEICEDLTAIPGVITGG